METKMIAPLEVPPHIKLDEPLQILVQNDKNMKEVCQLWQQEYKTIYPKYKINHNDPLNKQSHILYSRNKDQHIVSTARLTLDSPLGLPDDDVYPREINLYRERGLKLMEFGRFISQGGNLQLIKNYYKSVYLIALAEKVDVIAMTIKDKDIALHRNLMGAYLLSSNMNTDNGSQYKMACMSWEVNKTKARFFNWTRLPQHTMEPAL